MSDLTYEILRSRLDSLPRPPRDDAREVLWIIPKLLGVAVTGLGAFEIFLAGKRLQAVTAAVRRHLQHDRWQVAGHEPFEANRVVLPSEDHFKAVAALIVIEMVRLGLGQGGRADQDVFHDVEPIIELALHRGALPEEAMIGLIGELLCLEQVLLAIQDRPELKSAALDLWRGHQRSARDFLLGGVALEVKTTRLAASVHVAHSLGQIEPQQTSEPVEASLLLLSIGLAQTEGDGFTLPGLADRILRLLRDSAVPEGVFSPTQDLFLQNLRLYGGSPDGGYDHLRMRSFRLYQTTFTSTFVPRLYDLADEDIHLLRRSDLAGKIVLPAQVQYGFELPERVNELNPVPVWHQGVRAAVRKALGVA